MKKYYNAIHVLIFITLFLVFISLNIAYLQNSREILVTRGILLEIGPPWDTIDSGVAECFSEAVNKAKQENTILIYKVNSYGGYLDSAFSIADSLYYSDIPAVAYVENKALSAGTFIILPADIIALQKGSIIGAMKPVIVDPLTGQVTFVNESKIIEPIIRKAEVYIQGKNRNISMIEEFIYEAKVVDSAAAVKYGVADMEVGGFEEVVKNINGITIEKNGVKYRFQITPTSLEKFTCSIRSRFLSILSNAYLANMLLSIGVLAAIFAIASGKIAVLPLAIALVFLGLIGTGFNPNFVSALFVLLGIVMLAVELFILPGFGIVGITGIILLTMGFALLPLYIPAGIHPREEYISALRAFIFGTAITLGSFFGIVIFKVIQVKRKKPIVYTPEGREGIAIDDIKPGSIGFVKIEGEYWRATSKSEIKAGERIVVLTMRSDGVLIVDKKTT